MAKRQKKPGWMQYVVKQWRLPYGYTVETRIVSDSYIRKLGSEACYGCCYDFGSKAPVKLRAKQGLIYLNRSNDTATFVDAYRHEMEHMFVEWKGRVFSSIVLHGERP